MTSAASSPSSADRDCGTDAGPEVEVLGASEELARRLRRAALAALEAAGVSNGHLAVELVDRARMRELNARFRGRDAATDVLSFPIDGVEAAAGPRELGDVIVCPPECSDLEEAVVHGVLHLCGYDHERDQGQMLALQADVLTRLRGSASGSAAPRTVALAVGSGTKTRAGFVALAGRPNVGKSTLVNRFAGTKVAIVSDKPQTTRRELRGVVTGDDWQLVLCDLPGFQRPRDELTARMQGRVERALADSDVVLYIVSATEPIGPGDRFIAEAVRRAEKPTVAAVNKIDAVDRERTALALLEVEKLDLPGEIFPISAKTGEGVEELREHLVSLLPEGPFLYPPESRSDVPPELAFAELIREQVLRHTREEVPHAVEVEVSEIERRPDGSLVVHADLWCETESQKAILIGAGGRMVKAIGSAARAEMAILAGVPVHLDLRVRVRRGWRKDEGLLDRIGIR